MEGPENTKAQRNESLMGSRAGWAKWTGEADEGWTALTVGDLSLLPLPGTFSNSIKMNMEP